MQLYYQSISIRNALPADAPLLARWWNDGAVMAHAGFPKGLGTTAEKVAADIATDSDDTRRRLILEFENRPIGEMCFRNEGNQTVDIGIKICEHLSAKCASGMKEIKPLTSVSKSASKGFKRMGLEELP